MRLMKPTKNKTSPKFLSLRLFKILTIATCLLYPGQSRSDVPVPIPRPEAEPLQTSIIPPLPLPRPEPVSRHSAGVPALEGVRLSLADAIFIGLRENRTVKSAYINRVVEKFNLEVEEMRFVPRFSLSGRGEREYQSRGVSSTLSVSQTARGLTPTGAEFEFAWINTANIADDLRTFSSIAEISFDQPLLRGGGLEVNMAPLAQARLAEQTNRQQLKATVSEVIGTIIFAHRDLRLSQEALLLAQLAVMRAERQVENNRLLIDAGRIAAVDAIQTKASLEDQKVRVIQARRNLANARFSLLEALALDLDTQIVAVEAAEPKSVPLNVRRLVPVALTMRPDYLGQLNIIEGSKLGLSIAKNETLWDLNVFARGRYGVNAASNMSPETVSDASIGLRVNIPLNDPEPQRQVVQSTAEKQLAEIRLLEIRQGIERQIRGTVSETELLWEQLGVAENALSLSRQAVDIEIEKMNAGRSSAFVVRSLEDRLRDSENRVLAAKIGYLNSLTRLDLQLGTTLDTWRVDLRD